MKNKLKNTLKNKKHHRKLFIALGISLLIAAIVVIPTTIILLDKPKDDGGDTQKDYDTFTKIDKDDLVFGEDGGRNKTISKWKMPAGGSYYIKIDETTYVDSTGKPEKFSSVGGYAMDESLPVLEDLAIEFNQKNLPWSNIGNYPSYFYLNNQIKNLTIIFGENLIQPINNICIASCTNLHTEKTVLNIEDRTPEDSTGSTLWTWLKRFERLEESLTQINLTLTKTSGSRGHTKEEWVTQMEIKDPSIFNLIEE